MAKDIKDKKVKKVNPITATFSELKQVSWPTFGITMKRLGTVLVITGLFLLVLIGIDALLGFIHRELFQIAATTRDYLTVAQISALIVSAVLVVGSIVCFIIYKVLKSKNKD